MRRASVATHTTVRVTADELARLKARAAGQGRSLSRYLVERGLADGADAWPERHLAHEQAMVELRRAGAALARIARHLDAGWGVPGCRLGDALAELTRAAEAVERALKP